MLVAAGASLTTRDANGLTPMMIAFQVEDNDLATYLESKFDYMPFHFILFYAGRLNRFMQTGHSIHREFHEFLASANFNCVE